MELSKGNKIIAEFMGYKIWYINGNEINVETSPERCQPINEWAKYDSSWNWLMPCIGKISNQCKEPEELDGLKYALLCNDIDTAWNFVVDYLQNNTNKNG